MYGCRAGLSVAGMTASRRIGLVLAALLALGAAAETAHATAPGRNGLITFRRYLGPDRTQGAIFTVAPDGSGDRQVTSPPAGLNDEFPDYAADGSLIAFGRCGDFCGVFTVRPDGSHVRPLTRTCPAGEEPPACSDNWYPAVSPDVRQVAFVHAFGRIVDDQIDHVGIYRVSIGGGRMHRVTLPPTRAAEDNEPQWSPDGRRLIFTRHTIEADPADERQAIFVVNADGSGLRRVTPWELHAGDGPDWSPDGSRILFRSPENDDFLHSQLYTIRPDGSGLRQITHVPDGTKLYSSSFSPDGRFITFAQQGLGGLPDIYRMNADGTGVTPVAQTAAYDSGPDWGGLKR
jgi:Tol biopolymer transport system component